MKMKILVLEVGAWKGRTHVYALNSAQTLLFPGLGSAP